MNMRMAAMVAAALAATLSPPAWAISLEDTDPARVPIVGQLRDDDCGAAALATLMRMAGIEISEGALLRGVGLTETRERRIEGLTALDLRRMVQNSSTNTDLSAQFHNEDQLPRIVQEHPVIVLLYEFGEQVRQGTPALGHFVVLEGWSQARGFLVIDPALRRRGFMSSAELIRRAHHGSGARSRHILVMRLQRRGRSVAHAPAVTAAEENDLSDVSMLRRLLSGLQAGKTLLTLSFSSDQSRLSMSGDGPDALSISNSAVNLIVEHGLDNETTLGLSVGVGRSGAALRFPGGASFALGHRDFPTPMQISLSRRVELGLPSNVSTEANAGAVFEALIRPVGVTAGVSTRIQLGSSSLIGVTNASILREGDETFIDLNPSVGVARRIGQTLEMGLMLSGNIPLRQGPPQAEISVILSAALGRDWSVETYLSHGILNSGGLRSRQVGISFTYALPNRLRRSLRAATAASRQR